MVVCLIVCFCFVCLRHVSCVPHVASFSGLSILDFPFRILYRLFRKNYNRIQNLGVVRITIC
jgi:hypothetical protein